MQSSTLFPALEFLKKAKKAMPRVFEGAEQWAPIDFIAGMD
jgi:hypothetical protein